MSQVKFSEGNLSVATRRPCWTLKKASKSRKKYENKFSKSNLECLWMFCLQITIFFLIISVRRKGSVLSWTVNLWGEATQDSGERQNSQILHTLCRLEQKLGWVGRWKSCPEIQRDQCTVAEGRAAENGKICQRSKESRQIWSKEIVSSQHCLPNCQRKIMFCVLVTQH